MSIKTISVRVSQNSLRKLLRALADCNTLVSLVVNPPDRNDMFRVSFEIEGDVTEIRRISTANGFPIPIPTT